MGWKFKRTFGTEKSERSLKKDNQYKKHDRELQELLDETLENAELTDKQRLFCIYYVQCFNAAKAYQKAYDCNYKTSIVNASRMLTNANIKSEIQRLKQAHQNREFFFRG